MNTRWKLPRFLWWRFPVCWETVEMLQYGWILQATLLSPSRISYIELCTITSVFNCRLFISHFSNKQVWWLSVIQWDLRNYSYMTAFLSCKSNFSILLDAGIFSALEEVCTLFWVFFYYRVLLHWFVAVSGKDKHNQHFICDLMLYLTNLLKSV